MPGSRKTDASPGRRFDGGLAHERASWTRTLIEGTVRCLAWAAMSFAGAGFAEDAFPPSETIFPATTRLWVSMRDAPATRKAFESTQYGALLRDPLMKPFVDRFREQVRESGRQRMKKLGLTLEDIEMLPGGELAIGVVEPVKNVAATMLLVDAKGHERELQQVVASITVRMAENGARRLPPHPQMPAIVAFDLPPDTSGRAGGRSKQSPRQERAAFAIVGSAFVIADDLDLVVQTVQCLKAGRADSVASLKPFLPTMRFSSEGLPSGAEPLRWFVDPLAYAKLMESVVPPRDSVAAGGDGPERGSLSVDQLIETGFDCIKGAGGHVVFGDGRHEVWHRSFVFAPPVEGRDPSGPDRFDSAGRMLRFPNTPRIEPQAWIPSDASAWTAFEWDVRTAFVTSEPLVDSFFGEPGVFDDMLFSLREDPDSPGIDLEKDLVAKLGTRVSVISDYVLPLGPDSERLVIVIEARDEAALASAIEKTMGSDRRRRRVEENGLVIWESIETAGSVPRPQISNVPKRFADDEEERPPRKPIFEHSAVTVARGSLLIASHIDVLRHVLSTQPPLSGVGDCQEVLAESGRMFPDPVSLRSFGRGDESLRLTYESLRMGQLPASSSLFGQLLNALLGDDGGDSVRRQRIDGRPLPAFDMIKQYFGPSGVSARTVDEGWLVEGFSLVNPSLKK